MKFLPVCYRETQSEWYGKKGRPWHVCAAIVKKGDDDFEVLMIFLCHYAAFLRRLEKLDCGFGSLFSNIFFVTV